MDTFLNLAWYCYNTCNVMDNQRIIQSTPVIFSFKSGTIHRCFDYSRKSARTEHRQAFGSAKHVLASYLVVKSLCEKRR
jgi:hypothetical protein